MTNPSLPQLDLTTHCDCGGVTLSVNGQVISMFQCSCRNCQTVSGSGHASIVLLPADAVDVIGETKTYVRPADSGASFTRHFCPKCATTVWAQSSRAPGFRIVPVGLFHGHNEWFQPNQLIFSRSHPHWDLIEPAVPQYDAYRPERSQ